MKEFMLKHNSGHKSTDATGVTWRMASSSWHRWSYEVHPLKNEESVLQQLIAARTAEEKENVLLRSFIQKYRLADSVEPEYEFWEPESADGIRREMMLEDIAEVFDYHPYMEEVPDGFLPGDGL